MQGVPATTLSASHSILSVGPQLHIVSPECCEAAETFALHLSLLPSGFCLRLTSQQLPGDLEGSRIQNPFPALFSQGWAPSDLRCFGSPDLRFTSLRPLIPISSSAFGPVVPGQQITPGNKQWVSWGGVDPIVKRV